MVIEARGVRTVSSLAPLARLDRFDLVATSGLHALVGNPADGVSLALAALAGRTRLRQGTIRLDDVPVSDVPGAVVWLGRGEHRLPESMRVDAVIALAARVRGGRTLDPAATLATLDLEALAARRVRTLTRAEARAVELSIALAADARAVLLDEPLLDLEPEVAARAVRALGQRAGEPGRVMIVGTASEREAVRLGAQVHLLRGGVIVAPAAPSAAASGSALAVYRAVSSDARALLGSLAEEEEIVELESHGSSVRAAGGDARAVAAAIGRAAVRAEVDLVSLERVEMAPVPGAAR